VKILSRKTAKETSGSRLGSVHGKSKTEALQKTSNILNKLAAVIHKNKHNAAGKSKKVVRHSVWPIKNCSCRLINLTPTK